MKIKECLEPIIAMGVVVGLIMGGLTYLAKAEDVKQIKRSLDYHIVNQQREVLEQRLDKLSERYKGKPMIQEALDIKKDLEQRLKEKEAELKALEKK